MDNGNCGDTYFGEKGHCTRHALRSAILTGWANVEVRKEQPKVQTWYAFWYGWFGSHDLLLSHRSLKERQAKMNAGRGVIYFPTYFFHKILTQKFLIRSCKYPCYRIDGKQKKADNPFGTTIIVTAWLRVCA